MIDLAVRHASGRNVAFAWLAFLGFSLVAFPLFDAVNGMPDVTPLDLRFFHGPDEVAPVLEELGGSGRVAYARSLLIADLLWPIVYGTTLALTIAWGLEGADRRRGLVLLPVVAVAFDYVENLMIALQIAWFPDGPEWLAVVSSNASAVKWILAGAATVVAMGALVRGLVRRRSTES